MDSQRMRIFFFFLQPEGNRRVLSPCITIILTHLTVPYLLHTILSLFSAVLSTEHQPFAYTPAVKRSTEIGSILYRTTLGFPFPLFIMGIPCSCCPRDLAG